MCGNLVPQNAYPFEQLTIAPIVIDDFIGGEFSHFENIAGGHKRSLLTLTGGFLGGNAPNHP